MTVNTPFPERPATPWMHPFSERPTSYSGMGAVDVSQITGDITDVYRAIQSSEPGMYVQHNADGSYTTYRQNTPGLLPVGSVNLQTGIQGNLTSGAGVWVLLAAGVALIFIMRKR